MLMSPAEKTWIEFWKIFSGGSGAKMNERPNHPSRPKGIPRSPKTSCPSAPMFHPSAGRSGPPSVSFQDGEVFHQHEPLVDHAHPGGQGFGGGAEGHRFFVEEQFPGVGLVAAGEDRHEGGFARAVFAEEGVDMVRVGGEGDVFVGDDGPEAFGDVLEAEEGWGILFMGMGMKSILSISASSDAFPIDSFCIRYSSIAA